MIRDCILVVEDDHTLMVGLRDTFVAEGFEVLCAKDGEAGLLLALEKKPALILLDIMLPRVNGYEICREVRRQGYEMPIIMLTARGQEEDIVLGLNLGADDYVTKPFRVAELVARCRAFLRRSRSVPTGVISFGAFVLDSAAHKLFRAGVEVELTPKEFALLELFLKRPGRALARNDILNAVWGHSVIVTTRSVDRCVTTLRAKLDPGFIETIRDIGYRFEGET